MRSTISRDHELGRSSPNLQLWQKLLRMHWVLFLLVLALSCISVRVIYSATYANESAAFRNTYHMQMIWVVIGFIVYFVLALTDYRIWLRFADAGFLVMVISLVLVLFIGRAEFGARSWIRVGPIGFQPSELCKLAFILFLAQYFLVSQDRGIRSFFIVLFCVMVPSYLIFKQPALGSAAVFLPTAYTIMFVAGVRKRYLLTPIVVVTVIVAYIAISLFPDDPAKVHHVFFLKPFQENRILTFVDPNIDPKGAGWTINQSLNAIGSGGLEGKGYLQGTIVALGFLPSTIAHNDFIFPVLCEQWGFIGGGSLIVALGLVILLILRIAFGTTEAAGTYIASGIAGMLLTHIFVNVGMTIKVVPITGIPLPFISYGGTFLVVCLASIGLVQSIWIHRRNE